MLPTTATSFGFSGPTELGDTTTSAQGDPVSRQVVVSDFQDQVSLNRLAWVRERRTTALISPANPGDDIWPGGGIYPWLSAAEPLIIAPGGDANDSVAGTGAQQIRILGVDADFNEIEELVDTNGSSASAPTIQSFLRVNYVELTRVGTVRGLEAGIIVIVGASTFTPLSVVIEGASRNGIYTVPRGRTLVVDKLSAEADSPNATIYRRGAVASLNRALNNVDMLAGQYGPRSVETLLVMANKVGIEYVNERPWRFPERTDVWLRVVSEELQGNPVQMVINWSLRQYKNQ